MKKRIVLALISAAIIISAAVFSWQNGEKALATELNDNIINMMDIIDKGELNKNTYFSSNPYDYTKNNRYFDDIVAMGYSVFPLIEDHLVKSPDNGLREYLLAIAMERIAKVDLKVDEKGNQFKWETGKGFIQEWDIFIKSLPETVNGILDSGRTPEGKIASLTRLGTPGIPYLIVRFNDNDTEEQEIITSVFRNVLTDDGRFAFTGTDISACKKWIGENAGNYDDLKTYIDGKASAP